MSVKPEDEVSIHIDASPEKVWEMVTDIRRMGEWSPECFKAFWIGPKRKVFMGLNKDGRWVWPAPAIVTESEPGKTFAFRAASGVVWRYLVAPADGGTRLTEQRLTDGEFRGMVKSVYSVMGGYERRMGVLRDGMQTTLERIKAAAER